jgi:1,2-dihydroxy-3-keto-5-methylthiopentene dioxygenase
MRPKAANCCPRPATARRSPTRSKRSACGSSAGRRPLPDAGGDVLAAYAPEIERLKAEEAISRSTRSALAPDHPDRATLRDQIPVRAYPCEDEVRFFVAGEGLFTLHLDGRVFNMLCTQGDLIRVPAGMKHWFDMGPTPQLHRDPAVRESRRLGSDVHRRRRSPTRFPRHEPAPPECRRESSLTSRDDEQHRVRHRHAVSLMPRRICRDFVARTPRSQRRC